MVKDISADEFVTFLCNDNVGYELSDDDRIELFLVLLPSKEDFTQELFNDILIDYGVDNLDIIEK